MSKDLIAVLLGIASIAVILIYIVWKKHLHKAALEQLEKEFGREKQEVPHE